MADSPTSTPLSSSRERFLRAKPLSKFIVFGVLVFVIWLVSLAVVSHRMNVPHLERHRLEALANVGEAMATIGVLFSGLGFVALIATVWLQRTQIEAAIQGMEESTKAQTKNLEILRAQSNATLTAAQISALAILIPIRQQTLDAVRHMASMGLQDRTTAQLPVLETAQEERIADLERLLEQLRDERPTE